MKCVNLFLIAIFVLISSVSYAQDYSLKFGLSQIPFANLPYKDRYLPGGRTDGYIIDFDPNIEGKMYEDLQCKQYSLAKNNLDFIPQVYLKVKLPNGLYLGALSFGGCTEYRTDVLFVSDTNGNVKNTLECCVLNGDFAVKQYEMKSTEEVIIYQMIFESSDLMPYTKYYKSKPVKAYIRKTTFQISADGKFIKTGEQNTNVSTFQSSLLQEHNLWEPEAFNMNY